MFSENCSKFSKLLCIKNAVVKSLQEECIRFLTEYSSASDHEVATVLNHWEGYPALRFGLSHWVSGSYVILFLDRAPGRQFEVRAYICNLKT